MRIKEIMMISVGYLLLGVMCVSLNGCAVGMALHGKAEPEVTELQKGMSIAKVHFIMRNYTPVIDLSDGNRTETYKIEIGNEPSAGRALGHLAMDVLTWGVWELVGTPIEAFTSKHMLLTVEYEEGETGLIVKDIRAGKEKGGL